VETPYLICEVYRNRLHDGWYMYRVYNWVRAPAATQAESLPPDWANAAPWCSGDPPGGSARGGHVLQAGQVIGGSSDSENRAPARQRGENSTAPTHIQEVPPTEFESVSPP
jgi:hypothetical protein